MPPAAGPHDIRSRQAVGQRIARARELLGLTQAVVAAKLALARTTQVAVEQGRRAVTAPELERYATVLNRPVDYFLGLGVWGRTDFRSQFQAMVNRLDADTVAPRRRPGRPRGEPEACPEKVALMAFETLCGNYLELEEANGLPRASMPELPLPRALSRAEAEDMAGAVRARLGLGPDALLADLRPRLEDAFALRVYVLGGTGRLAAAAFHHPAIGAAVMLQEAPAAHMRVRLAVALGHLLGNREAVMVDAAGRRKRPPLSAFAAAFADDLLLPARGVRDRFAALQGEGVEAGEVAVVFLARAFGVPLGRLRARLEELRVCPPSRLRRLDETLRSLETPASAEPPGLPEPPRWAALPERYALLALRAHRQGLISLAHLADCLRTSEAEAARRLAGCLAEVAAPPTMPSNTA